MSVADQCRKEAEICNRRAQAAPSRSMRVLLHSVARTWLTLAERIEGGMDEHMPRPSKTG